MKKKNVIIICVDGGRLDRVQKSEKITRLFSEYSFFSQSITYAPYTVSSIHAIFTGTYGTKTGVNSYSSGKNFKNNDYKTLTEYLHDENYYTKADIIDWKGGLIIPKQGFDEIATYDEDNEDVKKRHIDIIKNIQKKSLLLKLK